MVAIGRLTTGWNRIVEELPGSASVSLFRVLSAGHVPSTTEVLASDASQFDLFALETPAGLGGRPGTLSRRFTIPFVIVAQDYRSLRTPD